MQVTGGLVVHTSERRRGQATCSANSDRDRLRVERRRRESCPARPESSTSMEGTLKWRSGSLTGQSKSENRVGARCIAIIPTGHAAVRPTAVRSVRPTLELLPPLRSASPYVDAGRTRLAHIQRRLIVRDLRIRESSSDSVYRNSLFSRLILMEHSSRSLLLSHIKNETHRAVARPSETSPAR